MASNIYKHANASHRVRTRENTKSVGEIIFGIAIRKFAFALAFPGVMKLMDLYMGGLFKWSAAAFNSHKGSPFMNYLYAILNAIAQNMTLIIVATVALIVLSMILEFHVQLTSAKSHAPSRKVTYRNGSETVEIECSNLQLQEVIRTMKSHSQQGPSSRRPASAKSAYDI